MAILHKNVSQNLRLKIEQLENQINVINTENSFVDFESAENFENLKNEFKKLRKKSAENLIQEIILNEFSRKIPFLEAKVKERLLK